MTLISIDNDYYLVRAGQGWLACTGQGRAGKI